MGFKYHCWCSSSDDAVVPAADKLAHRDGAARRRAAMTRHRHEARHLLGYSQHWQDIDIMTYLGFISREYHAEWHSVTGQEKIYMSMLDMMTLRGTTHAQAATRTARLRVAGQSHRCRAARAGRVTIAYHLMQQRFPSPIFGIC